MHPFLLASCNSLTCPSGQVCVEHTIPCIGRSCKKVPKCVAPGTCEAKECPPSHKCIEKDGPKCIRTIFTEAEVALLSKNN
uniref:Uncharacterized protein n=1 Tax=Acrobeloides nanus TaxID=290746 RepID=A0A914CE18_9BILA